MKHLLVFSILTLISVTPSRSAAQLVCSYFLSRTTSANFFINPTDEQSANDYTARLEQEFRQLENAGYREYAVHETKVLSVEDAVFFIKDFGLARSPVAFEFVTALQIERQKIKNIYGISDQTYYELARLTLGVLEVETKFGQSPKYHLKERFPGLVTLLKRLLKRGSSPNSGGLTQIKLMPDGISENYGFVKENLSDPYVAAIATMGYLAEALPWLKSLERKHRPDSIDNDSFYDHLIYIYNGRASEIINNTSTPDRNIYISRMRRRKPSLAIFYY